MLKKFKGRKIIPRNNVRTLHRTVVIDMKWKVSKGESTQA